MTPSSSSDVDPVREIRRIHMMLEDWIVGIRENVRPVEDALNDNFTWIGPKGEVCNASEMLSAFSARRTDAKGGVGPVRLDVDSIEPQRERYGLHLLTFEKQLTVGDVVQNTMCSVWLNETDRASTGLEWLHLQETPIDAPEATASEN